jgi:DNA sulfur modification protein DndB
MTARFQAEPAIPLPALRGRQGGRTMFSIMCNDTVLNNFFPPDVDPSVSPTERANRDYDPKRAGEIAECMRTNRDDYIMSTLTYAMDREGVFEEVDGSGGAIGQLHLPLTSRLRVIDGQYRRGAIKRALEVLEDLSQDDTNLLHYVEDDLERRKQMFSDMNWHQKPVTKSVNVAFDSRDPFSRAVQTLANTHELLINRVETNGSTVKSISLRWGRSTTHSAGSLLASMGACEARKSTSRQISFPGEMNFSPCLSPRGRNFVRCWTILPKLSG